MKKSIFTLAFLALIGYVSAQSLRFELDGNIYEEGAAIECTNDIGYEFLQDMQIRNLTSDNIAVVVEKEVVENLDGVSNYFCWGQCFSPEVSVSSPVELAAGEVSGMGALSFHAMFDDDVFGSIVIKYYAYEDRHPEDRISILVKFRKSGESIVETPIYNMSHAYPNPASSVVRFNFELSSSNTASISIYNLLGQEVKSQNLNGFQGQASFSVADLNEGIYFCNLIVNGQAVKTEKFVVKK